MNDQMKQNIRGKVTSYVKRAEEIKGLSKNGNATKKKPVADTTGNSKNSKDGKGGGDDDESGDPERRRMMQKFEGLSVSSTDTFAFLRRLLSGAIVTNPNVSFNDVVGLEQAKEALKEAVILPVKFPQLFKGMNFN